MSDSSRKHWQEDNNQYTFNQYIFYLVCLGLVIAGLVAWYFWRLPPEKMPASHFIAIKSRSGGELPAIPFQADDTNALSSTFKNFQEYFFDDVPSFEKEIEENLISANRELFEKDTVYIWLSAIGDVENGEPVVLCSQGKQFIPLDRIYQSVRSLPVQHVVLLLDCGHKLANDEKYVVDMQSDFNEMVTVTSGREDLLASDEGPKLSVVFANGLGELPLYSITGRRTLFGLALENVLKANEAKNLNALVEKVNEEMLRLGGQAAQSASLLGDAEVADLEIPPLNQIEDESGAEEKKDEDAEFFQTVERSRQNWQDLDKIWGQYQTISDSIAGTSPAAYASNEWNSLTHRMIRMAYADLQGQSIGDNSRRLADELRKFEKDQLPKFQSALGSYRLVATEENPLGENDEIMQAFLVFHGVSFRIQHYAALYDGLSWVMPGDQTLNSFRDELKLLSKACETHRDLFQTLQPPAT